MKVSSVVRALITGAEGSGFKITRARDLPENVSVRPARSS